MATMVFAWFVVALSMVMLSPLLLEISLEFDTSVAIVGQMTTVITFAAAVSTILIVPFIDRFDRRTAFVVAGLLLAVSAVLAMVSWNIWILALSRVLVGISYAFGVPTMFAATAELIPYEKRSRAIGWLASGMGLAFLLGGPIISAIAGSYGWRASFVFFAAISLLMVVGGLRWFPRLPGRRIADDGGILRVIRGAYVPIRRIGTVRGPLIATFLAGAPFTIWQTYMGAFFQETYGLSVADLTLLFALSGVGFVLGGVFGAPVGDRIGKKRMVLTMLALIGTGIFLEIQIIRILPIGLAVAMILSSGESPRMANLNSIMGELVPEKRGAMIAVYTALVQVGMFVVAVAGGLAVAGGGYLALGVLLVSVALVSVVLISFLVREPKVELSPVAAGPRP